MTYRIRDNPTLPMGPVLALDARVEPGDVDTFLKTIARNRGPLVLPPGAVVEIISADGPEQTTAPDGATTKENS